MKLHSARHLRPAAAAAQAVSGQTRWTDWQHTRLCNLCVPVLPTSRGASPVQLRRGLPLQDIQREQCILPGRRAGILQEPRRIPAGHARLQ